jgi:predicted RNA-binding Zn-ribbon protein involved in translation (DUF1610 family)
MIASLRILIAIAVQSLIATAAPVGICLHAYSPEAPAEKIECFEFEKVERAAADYRFFPQSDKSVMVTAYRFRGTIPYKPELAPTHPEFDKLLKLYEETARATPSTRPYLNPKILVMRSQAAGVAKQIEEVAKLPTITMADGTQLIGCTMSKIENGFVSIRHQDGISKVSLTELDATEKKALNSTAEGWSLEDPAAVSKDSTGTFAKIVFKNGILLTKAKFKEVSDGNLVFVADGKSVSVPADQFPGELSVLGGDVVKSLAPVKKDASPEPSVASTGGDDPPAVPVESKRANVPAPTTKRPNDVFGGGFVLPGDEASGGGFVLPGDEAPNDQAQVIARQTGNEPDSDEIDRLPAKQVANEGPSDHDEKPGINHPPNEAGAPQSPPTEKRRTVHVMENGISFSYDVVEAEGSPVKERLPQEKAEIVSDNLPKIEQPATKLIWFKNLPKDLLYGPAAGLLLIFLYYFLRKRSKVSKITNQTSPNLQHPEKSQKDGIEFLCPHCGVNISAEAETAGATADCPTCGKELAVPADPDSADTPLPQQSVVPPRSGSLPPVPGGRKKSARKTAKKKLVTFRIVGSIIGIFALIAIGSLLATREKNGNLKGTGVPQVFKGNTSKKAEIIGMHGGMSQAEVTIKLNANELEPVPNNDLWASPLPGFKAIKYKPDDSFPIKYVSAIQFVFLNDRLMSVCYVFDESGCEISLYKNGSTSITSYPSDHRPNIYNRNGLISDIKEAIAGSFDLTDQNLYPDYTSGRAIPKGEYDLDSDRIIPIFNAASSDLFVRFYGTVRNMRTIVSDLQYQVIRPERTRADARSSEQFYLQFSFKNTYAESLTVAKEYEADEAEKSALQYENNRQEAAKESAEKERTEEERLKQLRKGF